MGMLGMLGMHKKANLFVTSVRMGCKRGLTTECE